MAPVQARHAIVGGPTLQGCLCRKQGVYRRLRALGRRIERSRSPDAVAVSVAPSIRRAPQAEASARAQRLARNILCFCLLEAVSVTQPGFAQTAQTSPAIALSAPTPPPTTDVANSPTPSSSLVIGTLVSPAPVITPLTNPAVISPQAQLDYNLQMPLFGDLPLRQELLEKGIEFTAHYISQTAANTSGVHGTGTEYAQQVDFGFGMDLDKLGIWSDAVARFAMTDRAGTNLTTKTDGYFPYQSIFGQGQNLRFNEISLEKFLFGKELALKGGFYPMGNDFAQLPYLCNFTNDALCGHPITLFDNSGWADAPAGRWTARAKWHITDELQVQTAVLNSNPLYTRRQDGFKLDFNGSTGVIVPVEFKYQIGKKPEDYGGTYNLGAYYDSSARADLANPNISHAGLYGLYFEGAQQIIKWGPDDTDGLAIFGVYTVSDQNTAKFKNDYEAGVASRGVFPGRELDILSLGWVEATINQRFQFQEEKSGLPIQTNEQLVELNYAFQLTPSLFFRPGVQYDIRPGGTSTNPNTWIFDFHVQLTL
jgi:porin